MKWVSWITGKVQREILSLVLGACLLALAVSLIGNVHVILNRDAGQSSGLMGTLGADIAEGFFVGIGFSGSMVLLCMGIWGVLCLLRGHGFGARRLIGFGLLFFSVVVLSSAMAWDYFPKAKTRFDNAERVCFMATGGGLAWDLIDDLDKKLGWGTYILGFPSLILALTLVTGILPSAMGGVLAGLFSMLRRDREDVFDKPKPAPRRPERPRPTPRPEPQKPAKPVQPVKSPVKKSEEPSEDEGIPRPPKPRPTPSPKAKPERVGPAQGSNPSERRTGDRSRLPSLDLLDSPPPGHDATDLFDVRQMGEKLVEALHHFDITATVDGISSGPVVTRFELKPEPGVKISRIVGLSNDLALALKAAKVRIEAPIPGKAAVGVEVPNPARSDVFLKEILASERFRKVQSPLALALGKDITGKPLVADLLEMPHLLIAGATGSGKTVCLHAIIASLLFNAPPEKVRLVLIDPKMIELSMYDKIPNLLAPVVKDVKESSLMLEWIVRKMDERYRKFSNAGVQDLDSYNDGVKKGMIPDEDGEGPLPYVVVVIDELADLMMVASRKVEDSLTRLAQLARTAGIHAVVATQRPSVDVITGLIKANFPSRIAFRVTSKTDSRTILDMNGAESLIGKGDMLFLSVGGNKPVRAQCAYLTRDEINRLVKFQKGSAPPVYAKNLPDASTPDGQMEMDADDDDLYDEAVKIVVTSRKASASNLQRRLRIGYNRAARLVDLMEERGVIGPDRGPRGREVYISKDAQDLLSDGMNG